MAILTISCDKKNNSNINESSSVFFENTLKNVGDIRKGTIYRGFFLVKSNGNSDLQIKSLEPDCHCTISKYSKKLLKSGQTDTIFFSYNASNAGYFQQKIIVKTNTLSSPDLLIIRGRVLD